MREPATPVAETRAPEIPAGATLCTAEVPSPQIRAPVTLAQAALWKIHVYLSFR